MTKKARTKECERCNVMFYENYQYSDRQWDLAKFCSRRCSGIVGMTGKKLSEETKRRIGEAGRGRRHSEETKKRMSENSPKYWLGKKASITTRMKMSETHIAIRENHHNWKGGVTSINLIIRGSARYRLWRESVFERDDYTCQLCGIRGCELNADHIKPFSLFPELRFELSNGRALCVPCHRGTDTYAGRIKGYNSSAKTKSN